MAYRCEECDEDVTDRGIATATCDECGRDVCGMCGFSVSDAGDTVTCDTCHENAESARFRKIWTVTADWLAISSREGRIETDLFENNGDWEEIAAAAGIDLNDEEAGMTRVTAIHPTINDPEDEDPVKVGDLIVGSVGGEYHFIREELPTI